MPKLLEQINQANDIKSIAPEDYKQLAKEIRRFLVKNISKTGGHLSSNLGVVELTMALHLSLDLPKDHIVWDVGHQAYIHKLLTGRKDDFATLRKYEGMSGFPKTSESDCDSFDTGHSSTSISVALGLAKARDLQKENNTVVAVIGDGALTGGMAFEALNNAARLKSNMIIILNDNNMSISENVGGMSNYLGKIRTNQAYIGVKDEIETVLRSIPKVGDAIVDKVRRSKDSIKRLFIPGMLFEDIGITYLGPVDGHNIGSLMQAINSAKKMKEAVIIHVITKKGKGYSLAENNPSKFHGVEPFDITSGKVLQPSMDETYTNVFSDTLCELADENDKLVAITAAMPNGTGLTEFKKQYPTRFFDVGIAEEHAVTFAAGLAAGGMKPFVAVYSTFLQRAYDQMIHDVCLGNYPVVFAIDRAGIVGNDGETHQGIFDLSYLQSIPNMTILAPKNKKEFQEMLSFCNDFDAPIAIRYPRGKVSLCYHNESSRICYGKAEILSQEKEILILAIGSMVEVAEQIHKELHGLGREASVVNVRFIKPFDWELLDSFMMNHSMLVTLEENVYSGSFSQTVASYLTEKQYSSIKFLPLTLPNTFIEHGDISQLKEKLGLTKEAVLERIMEAYNK